MEITRVKVTKFDEEEGKKVLGVASITFDDVFALHGVKIIDGQKGLFIAMPATKKADGSFTDICHPINNDFRSQITAAVLDEFNK